jgi:hypothetical protein
MLLSAIQVHRRETEIMPNRLEDLPPEVLAEYHRNIRDRLKIDTTRDPDPLIDLTDIATLAGLTPKTPSVWRNRTKNGEIRHPFPEPGDPAGQRYEDKPLWRAVTEVIPYLETTGNWPPESGARPATRGVRGPQRRPRVRRTYPGDAA